MPDPANATSPAADAVLAALRELAGTGDLAPTVAALAELAELGTTRTRESLRELERLGLISVTVGQHRQGNAYRVLANALANTLANGFADPLANGLACARDRSEPSSSLSASGNGDRRARPAAPAPASAPARARLAGPTPTQEPAMPDAEPEPANAAGAAIAAAVAECQRQGKPELDQAAKKRIGSVAKRMHRDGITIPELQAAAIYLAAKGMSDLQAAHRAHLEATQTTETASELAERAAASAGSRAKGDPWHPISLAELAEVWHLLQVYWRRVALPPLEDADAWLAELRPCPVDAVLGAVRQWSRRTDGLGSWPPTLGQLRTVSRKLYGDELTYQQGRRMIAEQEAIARGEAKGDGSDPRAAGA